MPEKTTVLLTGATGFVGSHCYPVLRQAGFDVVGASRRPLRARRLFPGRAFRRMDVEQPHSMYKALRGCQAAVYLVHGMKGSHHYEPVEHAAAVAFRRAAAEAGVKRIVYLGGVPPRGAASTHLRSRSRTGQLLREGRVPTIELQASMVIGGGSDSFRMVRDLAARLPWMPFPLWSRSVSEPISIRDVAFAVCESLRLDPVKESRVYGLPGPEQLSAREIVLRTAALLGREPRGFTMPLVTPKLSSYGIQLLSRADSFVTSELVQGLRDDLVSARPPFWDLCPDHELQGFDEAVREALAEEQRNLSLRAKLFETALRRLQA